MAGPGMGQYVLPPRRAGVWVEFEQGDPSYPIWSGCWYGTGEEVPALASESLPDTPNVVLQTPGGRVVVLSDEPGGKGITLGAPGGASIVIDDTGCTSATARRDDLARRPDRDHQPGRSERDLTGEGESCCPEPVEHRLDGDLPARAQARPSPGRHRVLAQGSPAVTTADLFTVTGCPATAAGGPGPCTSVRWTGPPPGADRRLTGVLQSSPGPATPRGSPAGACGRLRRAAEGGGRVSPPTRSTAHGERVVEPKAYDAGPRRTDIAFPFRTDSRGRTAHAPYDEHVRDMIEQLLFTSPGERVMRPDFGCGLLDLVFAPNSPELASALQLTVHAALQQWLAT
ncbi:GPW/gp25 family protein [Streptomyces sp. SCUT-3]|uniref:GPW/gp25 family protein n=1 Tax=Streptomyces sp. SCUT-3 TaxID=2684469 RepID=UPI0031FCF359